MHIAKLQIISDKWFSAFCTDRHKNMDNRGVWTADISIRKCGSASRRYFQYPRTANALRRWP